MDFNSLDELKNRLMPALRTKVSDLRRSRININEEELWDILSKNKWSKAVDLTLGDMVNDILKFEYVNLRNDFYEWKL